MKSPQLPLHTEHAGLDDSQITEPKREQDDVVIYQKDEVFREMRAALPNLTELSADASAAAASERRMGFREGFRLYPMAVFFSFGLSLAVVMEGYDTWLLSNFYGLSAFARKFGHPCG